MVGKKINNYELRELVGDGAMGVVYLAEHPILRRRVAVKLLKRQYLESPSLVSRFVNEARAAAAIHHPNVIEVIDVGLVEQEVPYIMMEYLDGEPLSRRLTRERLGVGKAMDIAIQAARAVAASHAMEIVHRDLKPENLFLVPDPMSAGGERVKVLDFGIAKLRPDWAGDDGPKTRTGVIFGTPAYMSPEQCRGLNDEVDTTTDVYALGCILFEMLCGRAPYISQGWGDVLMMHMSDEIPVASAENPRVTPAIDHVIRTALAKSKTDRYPNMRDMHRALAQARNDVQDTPAPLRTSDPQLPAVVVGVDRLGRPSATGAAHAQTQFAANDTALGQPGLASRPRRRVTTLVVVGAFVVGGAGGLAVALRRPAEPTRATLPPPATTVAPPTVAPPEVVAPQEAPSKIADDDAAKANEATKATKAPTTMTTKTNTTGPKAKSEKAKSKAATAKSHHRTERRKDPAKW